MRIGYAKAPSYTIRYTINTCVNYYIWGSEDFSGGGKTKFAYELGAKHGNGRVYVPPYTNHSLRATQWFDLETKKEDVLSLSSG